MAWHHALPTDVIEKIITDENPENFIFQGDKLLWQGHEANLDQIEEARQNFITSFGSCSFDETREDLQELGLKESFKQ